MKKLSLFAWFLPAFLLFSITLQSQVRVKEKLNAFDFFGIYEMKGLGYFMCYEEKVDDYLEFYDYELNPVRKIKLDFNLKAGSFMHGASNGNAFLLTYFDAGKSRKQILAFDSKLKKIGEITTKENLNSIFAIDDETFGMLTSKGGTNYIRVYSNSLKQLSETSFGDSYYLATTSLENQSSMISAGFRSGSADGMFVSPQTSGNDYFFVHGWDASMFKYKGIKIFAFDKKGKPLYEYPLDINTQRPFFGYIGNNGDLYFMVTEGNYMGKPRDWSVEGYYTLVIDRNGKLKEKIKQDLPIDASMVPLSVMVEKEGCLVTCNGYGEIKETNASDVDIEKSAANGRQIFSGNTSSFFEFMYFDDKGKYIGSQKAEKGTEGSWFDQNYYHTSQTPDGERVYAVYHIRDTKSLSFHVAYADEQGQSKFKSKEIFQEEMDGQGAEKITVNWFNVFPAKPGKVVIALYSAKKKSAIMSKVDVTNLGK